MKILQPNQRVTLEFGASETLRRAVVLAGKEMPLGFGYSFQVGKRRLWVYEADLVEIKDGLYRVEDGR